MGQVSTFAKSNASDYHPSRLWLQASGAPNASRALLPRDGVFIYHCREGESARRAIER